MLTLVLMKTPEGYGQEQRFPIGHIVIRIRRKRDGVKRAWVKVGEPSAWRLRSHVVWEKNHGSIPRCMIVHHKDGNKLNDDLSNLELVTRSQHLAIHRAEFQHKCVAALARARRTRTWSTKSKTKRVGRHPNGCQCPLHAKPPSKV